MKSDTFGKQLKSIKKIQVLHLKIAKRNKIGRLTHINFIIEQLVNCYFKHNNIIHITFNGRTQNETQKKLNNTKMRFIRGIA